MDSDDDEKQATGEQPRPMSGGYTYKDGDWTYEELSEHRSKLLLEQRIVWDALGFNSPWLVTAEEVAKEARSLRRPFGWVLVWVRRLSGKGRSHG
jgi:hypothetical protein